MLGKINKITDSTSGYIILNGDDNEEVYFTASDLIEFGFNSLNIGDLVEFEIKEVPAKYRAINVCRDGEGTIKKLTDKRFGFITDHKYTDLFFHSNSLVDTCFDEFREGDSVGYDVEELQEAYFRAVNIYVERKKQIENGNVEIGLTLINNEIKLIKFFENGEYEIVADEKQKYEYYCAFFSESIRLKEAIGEFEYLINKPGIREIELHNFFERNPDFILNEEYKKVHSKVKLENLEQNLLIPDFVLEPYNPNALCDLLELKLPNVKLYNLKKKNRQRYSTAILEVCAQLREYAAYFDDSKNRKNVENKYGLNIYKPEMVVIIGRSKEIDPMQLKKIHSDMPGLHLITYDDVLEKAKRRKS